mmetsp:Transcript_5296/g.12015  ORF Transcript_5296/g.12015 Transcript_5296/m.12015 type:complete len:144 (-) Transcript_5296:21-452(-)
MSNIPDLGGAVETSPCNQAPLDLEQNPVLYMDYPNRLFNTVGREEDQLAHNSVLEDGLTRRHRFAAIDCPLSSLVHGNHSTRCGIAIDRSPYNAWRRRNLETYELGWVESFLMNPSGKDAYKPDMPPRQTTLEPGIHLYILFC